MHRRRRRSRRAAACRRRRSARPTRARATAGLELPRAVRVPPGSGTFTPVAEVRVGRPGHLAVRDRRDDDAHRHRARRRRLRRQGHREGHPGDRLHDVHRAAQYTTNGTLHAISIVGGSVVDKWTVRVDRQPGGADRGRRHRRQARQRGRRVRHRRARPRVPRRRASSVWTSRERASRVMPVDRRSRRRRRARGDRRGRHPRTARRARSKASFSPPLNGLVRRQRHRRRRRARRRHRRAAATTPTARSSSTPGVARRAGPRSATSTRTASPRSSPSTTRRTPSRSGATTPSQPNKFAWVRQGVDINGTLTQHCSRRLGGLHHGGGPPTVADFNGDGVPDVGARRRHRLRGVRRQEAHRPADRERQHDPLDGRDDGLLVGGDRQRGLRLRRRRQGRGRLLGRESPAHLRRPDRQRALLDLQHDGHARSSSRSSPTSTTTGTPTSSSCRTRTRTATPSTSATTA